MLIGVFADIQFSRGEEFNSLRNAYEREIKADAGSIHCGGIRSRELPTIRHLILHPKG